MAFDESKHPRDEGGKFASKNGGGGATTNKSGGESLGKKTKQPSKNPTRKDKYGNELVSDEAFTIGQKGVKEYLDEMTKFYDLEQLKQSNVFLDGLKNAVSESIEKAGLDENYDLTYQDMDEIIGSVLGEEVDTANDSFKHKTYTGYQPKQAEEEEKKQASKLFNIDL